MPTFNKQLLPEIVRNAYSPFEGNETGKCGFRPYSTTFIRQDFFRLIFFHFMDFKNIPFNSIENNKSEDLIPKFISVSLNDKFFIKYQVQNFL